MNGKEFVQGLYDEYYSEYAEPILAVRRALAALNPETPEFISLMQRQAKKELQHGIAFTKALLQYPQLDPHERAQVADQAADEYRHYASVTDYLKSRGIDEGDPGADAYGAYFDQFLSGDVNAFRLCNIAEETGVAFMRYLSELSQDPAVRILATEILEEEEEHGDEVKVKLGRLADDPAQRPFIKEHFIQSWATQKEGALREARELGIDVEALAHN